MSTSVVSLQDHHLRTASLFNCIEEQASAVDREKLETEEVLTFLRHLLASGCLSKPVS